MFLFYSTVFHHLLKVLGVSTIKKGDLSNYSTDEPTLFSVVIPLTKYAYGSFFLHVSYRFNIDNMSRSGTPADHQV